jgi:hypothetical protein
MSLGQRMLVIRASADMHANDASRVLAHCVNPPSADFTDKVHYDQTSSGQTLRGPSL